MKPQSGSSELNKRLHAAAGCRRLGSARYLARGVELPPQRPLERPTALQALLHSVERSAEVGIAVGIRPKFLKDQGLAQGLGICTVAGRGAADSARMRWGS